MEIEKLSVTSSDVFSKIRALRNCTEKDLSELHDWTLDAVSEVKKFITRYLESTDLTVDPELTRARMENYHLLCGALAGLIDGLYEKSIGVIYKKLTEQSRTDTTVNKQKLTAGDREVYAKAEAGDIKALRRDMEETIGNLEIRLYGWRATYSKKH